MMFSWRLKRKASHGGPTDHDVEEVAKSGPEGEIWR